jgi:hypothetical protein
MKLLLAETQEMTSSCCTAADLRQMKEANKLTTENGISKSLLLLKH